MTGNLCFFAHIETDRVSVFLCVHKFTKIGTPLEHVRTVFTETSEGPKATVKQDESVYEQFVSEHPGIILS